MYLKIHVPSVVNFSKIFHRKCTDFTWNSPICPSLSLREVSLWIAVPSDFFLFLAWQGDYLKIQPAIDWPAAPSKIWLVSIVLNNDNRPEPDKTPGQLVAGFLSHPQRISCCVWCLFLMNLCMHLCNTWEICGKTIHRYSNSLHLWLTKWQPLL